ncbi:MAG: hypothetical protein IJI41_06850 [Anaerolineaceae bacterium]|nr:hypothetical protein [Anaerolineaceae bacterium]
MTMNKKNTEYYLVWKRVVAKREYGDEYYLDYLFKSGKWVIDDKNVISDRIIGYDPYEPEDSPYRIGCSSVMMEMKEISEEEAISLMNQQILDILKEEWKNKFKTKKEEWDKNRGWPAKLVETCFTLNGRKYSLKPEDIGLTKDGWDQGFMESIQAEIERDLESYGATDVYNLGFLD